MSITSPPLNGEYPTEFHKFKNEFSGDLRILVEKYPVIIILYEVAAFFFGFTFITSFSLFKLLVGAFFISSGLLFAKAIWDKNPLIFGASIAISFGEIKTWYAKRNEIADETPD